MRDERSVLCNLFSALYTCQYVSAFTVDLELAHLALTRDSRTWHFTCRLPPATLYRTHCCMRIQRPLSPGNNSEWMVVLIATAPFY
jgi:hypothetical protein